MMILRQRQPASSRQLAGRGLLWFTLAIIFLISIFWNPEQTNVLPCYFQRLTGHSCPACGLSRSFHAISLGQLRQALQFHPLGLVLYSGLLALWLKVTVELFWRKEIRVNMNHRTKLMTVAGLIFIWIAFWIRRLLIE